MWFDIVRASDIADHGHWLYRWSLNKCVTGYTDSLEQ